MTNGPPPDQRTSIATRNLARGRDLPAGAPVRRRYLICSTGRSGSNLLCDLLEQTGLAGVPMEYLNGNYMDAWRRRESVETPDVDTYLAGLERVRTSANGVFGVKAHAHHIDKRVGDPSAFLGRFDLLIFLERDDKLAQAISLFRASVSGAWKSQAGPGSIQPQATPDFDPYLITLSLHQLLEGERAWRQMLSEKGPRVIGLRYETLVEKPDRVLEAIFRSLDIPERPPAWPGPRLRQQRDADSEALKQAYLDWLEKG
jgi:LPS sulfotransferase NodH